MTILKCSIRQDECKFSARQIIVLNNITYHKINQFIASKRLCHPPVLIAKFLNSFPPLLLGNCRSTIQLFTLRTQHILKIQKPFPTNRNEVWKYFILNISSSTHTIDD